MAWNKLSTGALSTIINGGSVDSPLVQVLGHRKIAPPNNMENTSERYRLLISDGEIIHGFAMLATQLNYLVTDGHLEMFTVAKIDKYTCNTVKSSGKDKRVMIILGISVVTPGSNVGVKIGNPINIHESAENKDPQIGGSNSNSAATPVSFQNWTAGSYFGGATNKPSRPLNTSDVGIGPIFKIASLTPYQNKWTIKARVTSKSNIRTYSNSKGEGKIFSVDLLDDSGEIRATGFNEQCDRLYDIIEANNVYYITRCNLKTANKQYSNLKNDFEMTFINDTVVTPCHSDSSEIPSLTFNFVSIGDIANLEKDQIVDVIGVCKSAGEVQSLQQRSTGRELKKRDIQIIDTTATEVNLTLWGKQAEDFNASSQPVVAVKGAKVSDFNGKSLSLLTSSTLQIDPDMRESYLLKGWFSQEGIHTESHSISNTRTGQGGGAGYAAVWKTIGEAKMDKLGSQETGDYYTCKAVLTLVKKENCLYIACPSPDCNKKVIDQNNGFYKCEKCNRDFDNYKWRLIMQANIIDATDNVWVTAFQEAAEAILGKTSDEVGKMQQDNRDAFNDFVSATVEFKPYIFRLRVKMETFNDESRLKTTVVQINPVDPVQYNKKLISEINEMMNS